MLSEIGHIFAIVITLYSYTTDMKFNVYILFNKYIKNK